MRFAPQSRYRNCSYVNDGDTAVVVGNTPAATNEMGVGYDYAAGQTSCM